MARRSSERPFRFSQPGRVLSPRFLFSHCEKGTASVMSLGTWGWNSRLEQTFQPYRERGLVPARVTRQNLDRYDVVGEAGTAPAVVSGRYRHEAESAAAFPAVGDWVAMAWGDPGVIHALLPRASCFSR